MGFKHYMWMIDDGLIGYFFVGHHTFSEFIGDSWNGIGVFFMGQKGYSPILV